MLAGDRSPPGDHLSKEFVQGGLRPRVNLWFIIVRNHDIHVNISITGVTKAGDRKTAPPLQVPRKVNQIYQPPTRNNDIFI